MPQLLTKSIRLGSSRQKTILRAATFDDDYLTQLSDGAESAFESFCAAHIRRDAIILDIGANIGVTSTILSRAAPAGQIYAVEPGPNIFAALSDNIRANRLDNVKTINCAVGDVPAPLRFNENSAYGHISATGGTEVTGVTIDGLITTHKLQRVDFLKIDVEGNEWGVLRGAQKCLAEHRPLVYMEFNIWTLLTQSDTHPLRFVTWLFEQFPFIYRMTGSVRDGRWLERVSHHGAGGFLHQNLFEHRCFDDLVMTADETRLQPILKMTPARWTFPWRHPLKALVGPQLYQAT